MTSSPPDASSPPDGSAPRTPGCAGRAAPRRPLRIAILSSWHADVARGSGTAASLQGLLRTLPALGHEPVVPEPPGLLSTPLPLPFPARRLAYNVTLASRLEGLSVDLTLAVDADGVLLRRPPRPYVVLLKGVAADEMRFEKGLTRLRMGLLARAEARNAARADLVVVPSEYSAGEAAERYGLARSRIAVVPEGIDLDAWSPVRRGPRGRPSSGSGDPPTVLTVARHYPRKNTAALVRAMTHLASDVPDARLRVVGGGPELPRLRRLAVELAVHERVSFLGPVSEARLRAEYLQATCFCLPSLQEAFGIVFVEAMAAGLPVVAARAGAVPEVVENGVSGLLVDGDRPDAIAWALARVLTDAELRSRLSAGALERCRRFGLERTVGALLERVADLPGRRSAPSGGAEDGLPANAAAGPPREGLACAPDAAREHGP